MKELIKKKELLGKIADGEANFEMKPGGLLHSSDILSKKKLTQIIEDSILSPAELAEILKDKLKGDSWVLEKLKKELQGLVKRGEQDIKDNRKSEGMKELIGDSTTFEDCLQQTKVIQDILADLESQYGVRLAEILPNSRQASLKGDSWVLKELKRQLQDYYPHTMMNVAEFLGRIRSIESQAPVSELAEQAKEDRRKAEAWITLSGIKAETKDKESFVKEIKEMMQTIWDLQDELLTQEKK